jgi:nitrous oxidase accessory protein NosD
VKNVTVKDLIIVNFVKGPFIEGCMNCSFIRVSADYWFLVNSQSNTITQSDISFGIGTVQNASGNLFFNNRIFAYGAHFNSDNSWDNGAIGNYWQDYNGNDTDGDGIGDTPYILPSDCVPNGTDHYPLIKPVTIQEFDPLPQTFPLALIVGVVAIAVVAGTVGCFFFYRKNAGKLETC